MAIYMINYDLVQPGQNYDDLIKAIKSYPAWCHTLESCWMIKSDLQPSYIRDRLLQYMDSNDKLLVIKVSTPAAWHGLPNNISDWIKNNL